METRFFFTVQRVSYPPTIKLVFASQKKSKVDEEKYYDLTNLPDPFFPQKKPTPPVRIQIDTGTKILNWWHALDLN